MPLTDLETLIRYLGQCLDPVAVLPAAHTHLHQDAPRAAAVLVPLLPRTEGVHVMFTTRAEHLPHHGGQVSFPGGQVEVGDRDFVDTALRETEEETGISREFVSVIGALSPHHTGTGFAVTPIVGVISPGFALCLDATEVAGVFEVPLAFVLDSGNYQQRTWERGGVLRTYHAIEYPPHLIWGATAAMLVNFRDRLVLATHSPARVEARRGNCEFRGNGSLLDPKGRETLGPF